MICRRLIVAWICVALAPAIAVKAQPGPTGNDAARIAFPVPATVRVMRDIVYAQYGDRQLRLDLYLPHAPTGAIPGVIVIRGGGWRVGDKEGFGFIAGFLASRGFAATSIEYRASDEAKYPAAMYDTKAAVRWMRANARTYGIDPTHIGAVGGSAGAHLAAMLATTGGRDDLEGTGGNAAVSSRVQAVLAMACPADFEKLQEGAVDSFMGLTRADHRLEYMAASPISYVSRTSAPILLLHSETDQVVPFAQSVLLEARYQSVGASATLVRVDATRTHDFWNYTKYFPNVMDQAVAFLRRTLTLIS